MRILYDPGILDMRNKGNIALLQAAMARFRELWPGATHEVITIAPHLLRLYCPDAIPVSPNGSVIQPGSRDLKYGFTTSIPRWTLRSLFELREEIWSQQNLGKWRVMSRPEKSFSAPEPAGIQAVTDEKKERAELKQVIQAYSLYVSTGAQYMSDACKQDALDVLDRIECASISGLPTVMVGQGFGPIQDPELKSRAKAVLPKVDSIFVREAIVSPALLRSFGVDASKVIFTGDDALEMTYKNRSHHRGSAIGVSLRVAHYTEFNHRYIETLRTTLQQSATQYKAPLVALPIAQSAYEPDEWYIEQVIAGYRPKSFYRRRFSQPVEIIKRAGRCRLVVTGTFHAAVFALAQGIPVVCLAKSKMYAEKFHGLADQFGSGCQVLNMDDEDLPIKLRDAINQAWVMSDKYQQELMKATERQISLGRAAYRKFFDLVLYKKEITMSAEKHRVSIGLPVFNAQKYLSQALDSILAQTFTDFELIISDNASTDRTAEICRAYAAKDARIRYFRNERNLGAAPNFNRVFYLATGEYFKWAPYDDRIAPEFLQKCVDVLDQHPDVVLCYSKARMIGADNQYIDAYDPGPDTRSPKQRERFRNLILYPEYAIQQMGLIRADVLRRTGLMRSFPSSDDVFLAEISLLGNFYEIPERLYDYRHHSEQSTQGPQRSRAAWFDASLRGKVVLAHWMYFGASLQVIRKSPLSKAERIFCYLSMGRWLFMPPHYRAMTKDLLIAAVQLVSRVAKPGSAYQEAVH